MAVKAKEIKCARCGERETVTRGEREQAALRAQTYRQRRRLST